MNDKDSIPPVPTDAPQKGEVYKHYKGNLYTVVGLALDSADEWVVVYAPLYKAVVAELFTRPLYEWAQIVEWEGSRVARFSKQ